DSDRANDVADMWNDENDQPRRVRVWNDDPDHEAKTRRMRLIRALEFAPPENDEDAVGRTWSWYELPKAGDSDGSKSNKKAVPWQVHTADVVKNATDIVARLPLSDDIKRAVTVAATFHDLG